MFPRPNDHPEPTLVSPADWTVFLIPPSDSQYLSPCSTILSCSMMLQEFLLHSQTASQSGWLWQHLDTAKKQPRSTIVQISKQLRLHNWSPRALELIKCIVPSEFLGDEGSWAVRWFPRKHPTSVSLSLDMCLTWCLTKSLLQNMRLIAAGRLWNWLIHIPAFPPLAPKIPHHLPWNVEVNVFDIYT